MQMGETWKRLGRMGVVLAAAAAVLTGCMGEKMIKPQDAGEESILRSVTTDKARYAPGEDVTFRLELAPGNVSEGKLVVQYKHLNELVERTELEWNGETAVEWQWAPPEEDYRGYLAEIYLQTGSTAADHMNIAIDVSSDWGKFPRYGYLADFGPMSEDEQQAVIDRLNRFHINGVQFYDWQWKHHMPLKLENGAPAAQWKDIANRPVFFETVKRYIDLAHEKNMKAMNYNLLFGAYEDAEKDGVSPAWGMFKDPLGTTQDRHPLPEDWASDIMLMDPANEHWKAYLFEQQQIVFEHLPFDGWHVDQLGDRGMLWNADSEKIDLGTAYLDFLQDAKAAIDVEYVMNAVSQYGQAYIAKAPVKFLYTEVWDSHPQYKHLKDIIDQNQKFSNGELNTVLAAYMNYDHADSAGEFNTAGVLLTDAVIFASGGAHIELGENMLAKEYFPNRNLTIPAELEAQLIHYYDFLTAYQNLLRDSVKNAELKAASANVELSAQAEKGKVWAFAKEKEGTQIIHLINFTDAVHMNWNDADATQKEPSLKENIEISVAVDRKAERVWFASPDFYNGSPVDLDFQQQGGELKVTLPMLKYWDMLVIECQE
jgi:dextranase